MGFQSVRTGHFWNKIKIKQRSEREKFIISRTYIGDLSLFSKFINFVHVSDLLWSIFPNDTSR